MDYYLDCNCIEMYKENGWMFREYVELSTCFLIKT